MVDGRFGMNNYYASDIFDVVKDLIQIASILLGPLRRSRSTEDRETLIAGYPFTFKS
jgi:hypothetical protein